MLLKLQKIVKNMLDNSEKSRKREKIEENHRKQKCLKIRKKLRYT